MEDLLFKNIFDDDELLKLSPDYYPTNVLLRIQTRSTMVKDTHFHKKDDGCQRKSIRRPKESFKIGKEIAKIRNGFEKINLKNQIMLKNAVKCVDNLKPDDIEDVCNEEYNGLGKEEEKYFEEISQMDLTIQNDSEFKLSDKPIVPKMNAIVRNEKKTRNKVSDNMSANDIKKFDREFDIDEILKIQCKKLKGLDSPVESLTEEAVINETHITDGIGHSYNEKLESIKSVNNENDSNMEDLHKLLVMMGISPKTNINEKESGNISARSQTVELSENAKTYNYTNVNLEIVSQTAESKNINEVLNITQMRIEITTREKALIKKYGGKWRVYVNKKKELEMKQREETLNSFFDKLTKRKMSCCETPESPANKAKLIARDYSRYRHRYQMQKHIIALQKAKLEEQNRIIEELKCNRIIEASKISLDAMRDEVRKTYYEMDRHLKPKLKTLTNELKVDIEEPSLVLQCLKVPQFLQRMEKRAREREEKHAIIRERRKQMEEERIRLKQQEELAKAQMDKEEKAKRIKELKDKRRREKIENIRKKQHAERMRALTVMADLHYEKTLKIKYAITPLKCLMAMKRDNEDKAKEHYKFQLKKNVFLNWMWHTEDMIAERNFKAEDFYRKRILRKCFDALKKNHHFLVLKKQVAEDYYDLYVVNLVFRKLREAINVVKREHEIKYQKAALYHNSNLLFRSFSYWRTLPALNALKREQEARKARWREKVLQVVPDYMPPED